MGEIHDVIAAVAADLPAVWVDILAKGIEAASSPAQLPRIITDANIGDGTGVLARLANSWSSNPQISSQTIAFSLRSAVAAYRSIAQHQSVELVWTGPATPFIPMRRTEQVVQQVIDAARHHLLMTSYVFVNPGGIVSNLRSAVVRGVKITAILEPPKSRGGVIDHDPAANLIAIVPTVNILEWTPEAKTRSGMQIVGCLHAKMLLADADQCFITSANFTGSAFERNIELGTYIIGGNHPRQLKRHFDALVELGLFDRR